MNTRIVDLIPRRSSTFVWIFVAGCVAIAGLEALYLAMPFLAPMTTDGHVATFDLDGEGSLAVWFSTVTLLLAACAAAIVAGQHKARCPGGIEHRFWQFVALCWTVMSIDECASVHEAFKEMVSHSTGERLYGDGTIWWVLAYLAVLGVVGLWLLWELRRSLGATACLLGTATAYSMAVLGELGIILPQKLMPAIMLEEGCEMLGNLFLVLAMALEARRLIQEQEQASAATSRAHRVRSAARVATLRLISAEAAA